MALCTTTTIKDSNNNPVTVPYLPGNLQRAAINFATATDHELVALSVTKTIKLYKLLVRVSAAMTLTLKDGSSAIPGLSWDLSAGDSVVLDLDKYAHFEGAAGQSLSLTSDQAGQVSGYVLYLQS